MARLLLCVNTVALLKPFLQVMKKIQVFNRANKLRLDCEFDKAAGLYESIIADFPDDSEAYWGLVLCKYGVEYVEDPDSHERIPTVHRARYQLITNDGDYKSALENADTYQKTVYEREAERIEIIQNGILDISKTEEPYDVFICYKETDNVGQRTEDSVLAYDIYERLTEKGYRVFFSRVTLDDKLGQEFEPYIFSALNSAKVMLVVGTKAEYFNAVWVKNEWSRFLEITSKDKSKVIIPCYKDMNPSDLPEELGRLQSQDMNKLGAMQDLIFGIGKLFRPSVQNVTVTQSEPESVNTTAKKKPVPLFIAVSIAAILAVAILITALTKHNKSNNSEIISQTVQSEPETIPLEVGDHITFGQYEQNNASDGKEDISWIIIDKKEDRLLLISEYALDCHSYNIYRKDVTWETCEIRQWLNGDFYGLSFSNNEKSRIIETTLENKANSEYKTNGGNDTVDKVFLLSEEEYKKYFNEFSKDGLPSFCSPTDYAVANGAFKSDNSGTLWWLRTPGGDQNMAMMIITDGLKEDGAPVDSVWVTDWGDGDVETDRWGVCARPAVWIKAESSGGSVDEKVKSAEKSKPKAEKTKFVPSDEGCYEGSYIIDFAEFAKTPELQVDGETLSYEISDYSVYEEYCNKLKSRGFVNTFHKSDDNITDDTFTVYADEERTEEINTVKIKCFNKSGIGKLLVNIKSSDLESYWTKIYGDKKTGSGIPDGKYYVSTNSDNLLIHYVPQNGTTCFDRIPKGTAVTVIDSTDGWALIQYGTNKEGWVSSDYLSAY